MGLPAAIKAHGANDLVEAERHYKRALAQNSTAPVLFQNYGSLLASIGKSELAAEIYKKGLNLYPDNHNIIRNYANLLRTKSPSTAISLYLRVLKLISSEEQKYSQKLYQTVLSDVCDVLMSIDLNAWAFELLREGILTTGLSPAFLKNVLLLSEYFANNSENNVCVLVNSSLFNQLLQDTCDPVQKLILYFSLGFHHYQKRNYAQALRFYQFAVDLFKMHCADYSGEQIVKVKKLMNDNGWNFSCLKLNLANFDGWKLFDYGLCATAPGKQRWQRALTKPFSDQEIPIWRGESLVGMNLFLMEEQAVGDVMMFMTCLPDLLPRLESVTIFMSNRLAPIYKRTFKDPIWQGKINVCMKQDVIAGALLPANFDFQSAIGSMIQYLYSSFEGISRSSFKVIPNVKLSRDLASKYLASDKSISSDKLVVGISWRGGGTPKRSEQKSFNVDLFATILTACSGIKYVSLQYGESSSQCELWRKNGIDVVHDPAINPLKDMDSWLAQVEACDAILSVANTTIHGAGSLNKPTLCLLSQHCDWRWFYDSRITRSYWYSSVGIAKQGTDGDWSMAVSEAIQWLGSGCPLPVGPQFL